MAAAAVALGSSWLWWSLAAVQTAAGQASPTGTTVFYFPGGVKGAVDVRGGAPGTVNATALMNSSDDKMMQAVVFSAGSGFASTAMTRSPT